jgi:acyl-CoA synthetase (AMP-forming)/AMP-acid ligase II
VRRRRVNFAVGLEGTCRAHLANYKIPKRFVIETELPLLPIGKLDKRRSRSSRSRMQQTA